MAKDRNRKTTATLQGCESYSYNGRTFRKGQAFVLTNRKDIDYFMSRPEFVVDLVEDDVPASPALRFQSKKAAAPVDEAGDEDEETDEADSEEDEEADEEEAPKPVAKTKPVVKPDTKKQQGGDRPGLPKRR